MRMLLILALVIVGGSLAANAPVADAAGKAASGATGSETKGSETKRSETKRITKPSYKRKRPRHDAYSRRAVECERARHADPTGRFSGFPCWAQEALSPQSNDKE